MVECGLPINPATIYSEYHSLKTDKKNSLIYDIINKYLTSRDYDDSLQNTMRVSNKFFEINFGDIIGRYNIDIKKKFNKKRSKKLLLPDPDNNNEMLSVPKRIGHNYIPIEILSLNELKTKYSRHKRLRVFNEKGLQCVSCERIGKYLIAAQDKGGNVHIDVYTKDFELMTVDHIKPKSKGGNFSIKNLDPMCCFCNTAKGDKYVEESTNEPEKN